MPGVVARRPARLARFLDPCPKFRAPHRIGTLATDRAPGPQQLQSDCRAKTRRRERAAPPGALYSRSILYAGRTPWLLRGGRPAAAEIRRCFRDRNWKPARICRCDPAQCARALHRAMELDSMA